MGLLFERQKGIKITNTFEKTLDKSRRKPNKLWVDKGSEFCNRSIKSCLKENDVEMYSTYDDRKLVVAERFIRNMKNRIYRYMTSIPKTVYVDKLDDIVHKYNNNVK